MKKLSSAVIKQVKGLLPELRKEVMKEFPKWSEYRAGSSFFSDEKVIEHLPASWYEYTIIYKKIHTDRDFAFYCLHHLNEEYMRGVISHTLKRLAFIDYYLTDDKKEAINIPTSRRRKLAIGKV